MTKLHIARALVERGFQVFPVQPGAKAPPLLQDWPRRAAKTLAEVESMWAAIPEANVAIHCAGFLVVDVDTRNDGDVSLETLAGIYDLPPTLTTRTPTGGRHLFYRLPESHPGVGNSAGKLGRGLDIKTTGGYVIAPGSDVEAGRYHFEADVPIADAPIALLDFLGSRTPKARDTTPAATIPPAPADGLTRAREWLAGQPQGEGAYATACGLRDRGVSLDQAQELMAEHDPRPNVPEKVEHAYRYAQGKPGAKAAVEADFPVAESRHVAADDNTSPRVAKPTLLRLDELAARQASTPYLVKGTLARGSYALIYGDRGEGKTFVALDIAYAVASGRQWMGKLVKQGTVLYLAFEGAGGLAKRAAALRRHYGEEQVPFYVDTTGYNLRELEGRRALGAVVAAMPEKPALIVIDTFAHALRGGDENSAQDVGAFNTAVQALIASTGACVLVIHHSGKNKSNGPRGSSALGAAIDTEIEIAERRITATKQRDIELGNALGFKLTPIPVGDDEDGEIIQSCVVEGTAAEEKSDPVTGNARLAFEVLCRLAKDNAPVAVEQWREACEEFLGSGRTVRQTFFKIKSTLLDKGYILCDDGGMITRRME